MNLILRRYSYSSTETEGWLFFDSKVLYTMEQPWNDSSPDDEDNGSPDDAYPAGRPYFSCIPEGTYEMRPFTRPSGEATWVLENVALGVYAFKEDRIEDWQRFLCLPHKGNFVGDTEGCVLPGLSRALLRNEDNDNKYERAVANSASAMNVLRDSLGELSTGHTMQIMQERGALYGQPG